MQFRRWSSKAHIRGFVVPPVEFEPGMGPLAKGRRRPPYPEPRQFREEVPNTASDQSVAGIWLCVVSNCGT